MYGADFRPSENESGDKQEKPDENQAEAEDDVLRRPLEVPEVYTLEIAKRH